MKNVLSIDGGGIRGIIPGLILEHIENETGFYSAQLFDLFAGTSTGGILALCLTKRLTLDSWQPMYSASEAVEIYRKCGLRIFPKDHYHYGNIKLINILQRAKFPSSGIDSVLQEYLGEDTRLSSALKPCVAYSVMSTDSSVVEFSSLRAGRSEQEEDYLTWEVARATSAAPTYFHPMKLSGGRYKDRGLLDGGLVVNNPAQCAYMIAQENAETKDAVFVLSLGTGAAPFKTRTTYDEVDKRRLIDWASKTVPMIMDATSKRVHESMMRTLASKPCHDGVCQSTQYIRLQCKLEPDCVDMDDASDKNIARLTLITEELINDNQDTIRLICERLKQDAAKQLMSKLEKVSAGEMALMGQIHARSSVREGEFAGNFNDPVFKPLHDLEIFETVANRNSTLRWNPYLWRHLRTAGAKESLLSWRRAAAVPS